MLERRGTGWLKACALLFGVSCSAQTSSSDNHVPAVTAASSSDPAACNTDDDCATGKHCQPVAEGERQLQIPNPMVAPCPYSACTSDAACGTGSVCEPLAMTTAYPNCFSIIGTCNVACSSDGATGRLCGEFERCATDGHCVRQRCDEPDFAGCPATMQCDATYIWDADPNVARGKYAPYGTPAAHTPTQQETTAAQSGCVYRHCDDAAGYQCLPSMRCDPANAKPETTGCVGIPCEELGHCSSDDYYLCTPTSSERHSETLDAHGCTYKNCEERPCSSGYTCDFEAPESDVNGCRVTLCDEPGAMPCAANYKCAPDEPRVNSWGCVPRQCDTDGFDCATLNQVCGAEGEPGRNIYGCVSPPPPATTATATAVPNPSASQVVANGSGTSSAGASALPLTSSAPQPSGSVATFVGVCQ
jgi:hypothetical protein